MTRLPRLALGTVQPGADSRIIAWALMNALTRSGYQVQHFHSRCCFGGVEGALASAGLASRHLDSWLMRPELCRELFEHASRECDVSIVEGRYAPAEADASPTLGGQLEPLCQWLGLARVGVLDLSAVQNCRLPPKPRVDALLLDRVRDEDGFYSLQTVVESLWRVPVVGGLEDLADLRAEIDSLPLGSRVGTELCDHLGASLARFTNLDRIAELGRKHELPDFCARPLDHACRSIRPSATTVAMAYDDAFHSHFPDTLDLLEMLGAHVVDFSPLHDESLPLGVDLVYLGCGRPDLYAEQLSNNACMRAALSRHARNGGRIYAEGGGVAYLCEQVESADGQSYAMTGVLPATAALAASFIPFDPVEVALQAPCWLGGANTLLRGYRNLNWRISPTGNVVRLAGAADGSCELLGRQAVIASLVHFNFAAQLHVLRSLVGAGAAATC